MIYDKMKDAIIDGDDEIIVELVNNALGEGVSASEILENGLIPGMDEVGRLFKEGELFVPEVLMSSNAMQAANELLKPLLIGEKRESKGKIVIGTVKGDLHDIGKKLVGMMLEGAGYEVIDLGVDVDVQRFLGAIDESNADCVGMSAMLTTTMTEMADVVNALQQDEKYKNVKIMIGGAPVSEAYAEKIGARFSYDAGSAVELANEILA